MSEPADASTETAEPTTRPPLGRDFRLLLSAGTVSNLGDGIDATALPLLAALLTRDPLLFAGVAVAQRVPWLLFALQAGALADRVDRRQLMVSVNAVRALLLGFLGFAVLTDTATIWMLYAVAFALGVCEVVFDTAAQAFLPRVVSREHLERANGMQYGAEIIANQFVGPPLGGLLFAASAAIPILLDAGTFAVSAMLLVLITAASGRAALRPGSAGAGASAPTAEPEVELDHAVDEAQAPRRPRVRDEIAEGLRWLRAHRLLRSLAVLLGLMNGTSMMFFATFALFALELLGLTEFQFGLLMTSSAIGSVGASLVSARVVERIGRAATLRLTLAASIVVPLVMGGTSSVWVVAAGSVAFGLVAVLWNVITVSMRQAVIPDHLLGRVNAVYRFLGWGSMPVGAWLGGVLASVYGLRAPFLAASLLMLVGVMVLGRSISTEAIDAAYTDAETPT